MLASTTFEIPSCEIVDHKGVVRVIVVRSPTISQGILGGLKNIIGGKIGAYIAMCEQLVAALDVELSEGVGEGGIHEHGSFVV